MTDMVRSVMLGTCLTAVLGGIGAVWQAVTVPLERAEPIAPAGRAPTGVWMEPPAPMAFDPAVPARDLFRPDRVPPAVPFDPLVPDGGPPPQPERAPVVLVGVVLGHPRAALLRGVGGSTVAVLLIEGEERNGTRLLRVAPDEVRIAMGRDTVTLGLSKEGG